MAVFLLSGAHISKESSVDAFHRNADRLGVVVVETCGLFADRHLFTPRPLKQALLERLPYVDSVVQTRPESVMESVAL